MQPTLPWFPLCLSLTWYWLAVSLLLYINFVSYSVLLSSSCLADTACLSTVITRLRKSSSATNWQVLAYPSHPPQCPEQGAPGQAECGRRRPLSLELEQSPCLGWVECSADILEPLAGFTVLSQLLPVWNLINQEKTGVWWRQVSLWQQAGCLLWGSHRGRPLEARDHTTTAIPCCTLGLIASPWAGLTGWVSRGRGGGHTTKQQCGLWAPGCLAIPWALSRTRG